MIILTFNSCLQTNEYLGHRKCDRTGIAKDLYNNGTFIEGPIATYYEQYDIDHYEFIFHEDGEYKFRSIEKNGEISEVEGRYTYIKGNNSISLVPIRDNSESGKLEILEIKKNVMKITLGMMKDEEDIFVMNLQRVNHD